MRRRSFLTLVGGAAAWPVAACAQAAGMPVIGLLTLTDILIPYMNALRQGLREAGFVEGQDVLIEVKRAQGQYDRLGQLATDLVNRKVTVIAASGGLIVIKAAASATSTIPVVFSYGGDPVKDGLVQSFGRPGGNVTGVTFLSNVLAGKRLERLHDVLPNAKIIGALINPNNANTESDLIETQAAAESLGLELVVLKASSETEIDTAFDKLSLQQIKTLFVDSDNYFSSRREQIMALAFRHGIAACMGSSEHVRGGALMSYSDVRPDSYRQFGAAIGHILRGALPAEIPVVQPTRFEFAINLRTARALGLTISKELLLLADEVIE